MATLHDRSMFSSTIMSRAIAGAIAGITFAMVEMIVAEIQGNGFFMPLRMIAAIVLGEAALQPSYSLVSASAVGLVVHMMLSAIYGVVFAVILTALPSLRQSAPMLLLSATLFGFVLWVVNFFVIAPVAFEWFGMADSTVQFIAHTFAFGTILVALLLMGSSRRGKPL